LPLHALLLEIVREVLREPLRQRRDQDALVLLRADLDLLDEVGDLAARGTDLDLGVDEARGTDDLLDDLAARGLELVRRRRRRDEDHLRHPRLPLLEPQRAVVERARQAEAVVDQRLLARAVAVEHAVDLRNRRVAFVDDAEEVLREVVEQRRGGLSRRAARQVARVVLDALAVADLAEQLEVVLRPGLQPLRLEQLPLPLQLLEALLELDLDRVERGVDLVLRHDEMLRRVYYKIIIFKKCNTRDRVDFADAGHVVAVELDAQRALGVRGADLDRVAADAELAALRVAVGPLVLDVDELPGERVAVELLPLADGDDHAPVVFGGSQAVDAGDRGDDDHVAPRQQRAGGGEAEPVDVLV